jgi:glycosyltransferase involved in cell wall biosynthesis
MLTGDEKYGAFRCSDAFVLPSHQENFGIAVAESLACGKPVMISRRINTWREIENAGACLVENDDLPGTLNLLRGWVAMASDKKKEMGERAIACYEDNFTVEKAAADLDQVIRTSLGMFEKAPA